MYQAHKTGFGCSIGIMETLYHLFSKMSDEMRAQTQLFFFSHAVRGEHRLSYIAAVDAVPAKGGQDNSPL